MSLVADQIHFETPKCLISVKPPHSNLTQEETKALRNLRSDPDFILLPADKRNVISDKTQYISKIMELLTDGTYIPLKRDLTLLLEQEISSLIKLSVSHWRFCLIPRNSKPPRL
ncbi:hypothetical protein Trydic_g15864 [Trypoxylus dichotomus]